MSTKKIFFSASVIMLFSMLLKLYYAYIVSFYIYCDTAIMGLMAEQILKGEFPLFFYGGFYTWTIESYIIALFFFLLGISNYTIYLGPIFISVLFLISTYFLGKEFENKRVGLLALIYSAFPSFYFFKYSVIPVGYLAELPLLGNLILLLTLKIIKNRSFSKGFLFFMLLGSISALSFWLHFIALYYLTAVALFLFLNMLASRNFKYYLFGGLISFLSFLITGLPCWIFNFKHNFISFTFSNTEFSPNILYGLKRFITYQIPGILGNNLFTILIFTIGFFLILVKIRLKNLLLIFFFIFMAVLFSQGGSFMKSKDFRYIIPIFSLIPVVIAYFLEWVNKRLKYLGTGLFIVLISINIFSIRNGILCDANGFSREGSMYNELMDYFEKHGIDGVYGRLEDVNTISFLGRDKLYAAEVIDNANPFDEKVLRSKEIAYINRGDFGNSFDMLCKSYKKDTMNRYNIIYDFEPWGYYGEEIIPQGWKARSNYNQDWINWAFDRNLDRYWSSITPKQPGMLYEIEFPEVYNIYKMQIFNMPSEYSYRNFPDGFKLYISLDGKDWDLIREGIAVGMFWSGPHVLWRQRDTIWEVVFPPTEARFIRIENTESSGHNTPWEINEIFFYKYIGDKRYTNRNYLYNAKKVYEYLKNKKIKFVYTDYWLSEKVREWSKGDIQSLRVYNNSWPDRPNTSRFINLNEETAIIVNNGNKNAVENILIEFEIKFERKNIEDYVCFYFSNNQDKYFFDNLKSLYWANMGICKVNLRGYGRFLMDYAVLLEKAGHKSDAEKYYKKAVRYFPGNPYLRYKLLQIYKDSGLDILYKREKLFIKKRFSPVYKCKTKFESGIEFLGLDLEQLSNDLYRINYFWKLDKNVNDKIFVFVHFVKDGKIVFQNDHPLLEDFVRLPVLLQDEIWKESYIVKIPNLISCGEYVVKTGLWLPEKKGRRLRISGSNSTSVMIENVNLNKNKLLKDIQGKIVFQSDAAGNNEIYTMDANGGNAERLTFLNTDSGGPRWSPNGRNIIFSSKKDGNSEIYIMDKNGKNQKCLTNHPANDSGQAWYSDGERIIFVSDRDGAMNFYSVNKDGSVLEKITDFKDGVHDMPRISPDEKKILFTSNMSLGWQVFSFDTETKEIKQLTSVPLGHCEADWSPDGKNIVLVSRLGTGSSNICIMDKNGKNIKSIVSSDSLNYNPRFSSDNKKIIFISNKDGNWEIYSVDIDGNNLRRITYTDLQEQGPDWVM